MSERTFQVGVIGAGNMAEAIFRGALEAGVLGADAVLAADPSAERRAVFEGMGIEAVDDAAEVVRRSRRVLLSVKPQTLPVVGPALAKAGAGTDGQTLISIMAGVRSDAIAAAVARPDAAVVRVMPNTPLMVGRGMSAVCANAACPSDEATFVRQLFAASGEVVAVEESQMDAVTAVSGSGPAYLFYLSEAIERAGVALGLDAEVSAMLARQTLAGAAALLVAEGAPGPAELRARVTSPGGTTAAAIATFDEAGVGAGVEAGLRACAARSIELGGG